MSEKTRDRSNEPPDWHDVARETAQELAKAQRPKPRLEDFLGGLPDERSAEEILSDLEACLAGSRRE